MSAVRLPTIAAIATAPGRGGIGVIRLSGQDLLPMARALSGGKTPSRVWRCSRIFRMPTASRWITVYCCFPGAAFVYRGRRDRAARPWRAGGDAQRLLRHCLSLGAGWPSRGVYPAGVFESQAGFGAGGKRGGFDRRRQRNRRRQRAQITEGEFSQRIHALVDQLIHLRMLTEATLDFPEEEDVDYLAAADAQGQLRGIQATLDGCWPAPPGRFAA